MISVCMATYNGELYIKQQLDSIMRNLSDNDELIISDDGSTDNTINIIKNYIKNDSRIRLLKGPKKGVVKNFENAIKYAHGHYIFLSDQDDIWADNKVKEVLHCFQKTNAMMIVHDCNVIDKKGNIISPSFFSLRNSAPGLMHNLIKNSYIGCCMAFNRDLVKYALPIPENIIWHDEWLGLVNDMMKKKSIFLPKVLFSYRRHGDNVSSLHHSSFKNMILLRFIFVKELMKRYKKLRARNVK